MAQLSAIPVDSMSVFNLNADVGDEMCNPKESSGTKDPRMDMEMKLNSDQLQAIQRTFETVVPLKWAMEMKADNIDR